MATYDVDARLLIAGKVKEIYENEDGIFYQLRVKYGSGESTMITMAEEDTIATGDVAIDTYVNIVGKVIDITKNEDGTFYNLKVKHLSGSSTLSIEEQYIKGVAPEESTTEESTEDNNTSTTDDNNDSNDVTTP